MNRPGITPSLSNLVSRTQLRCRQPVLPSLVGFFHQRTRGELSGQGRRRRLSSSTEELPFRAWSFRYDVSAETTCEGRGGDRAYRGLVMRTVGVCSIGTIVSDGAAGAIPTAQGGIPIQSYMQGPGGRETFSRGCMVRSWQTRVGKEEGCRGEQASTDVVFRVCLWLRLTL